MGSAHNAIRQQNANDEKSTHESSQAASVTEEESQAHVADGIGNRAENAERRGIHHQVRELETWFREAFANARWSAALRIRNENERHGKENAEHTICRTCPRMDFAMFSGKISVMSCVAVCGET